jgi:hypothetical protein
MKRASRHKASVWLSEITDVSFCEQALKLWHDFFSLVTTVTAE